MNKMVNKTILSAAVLTGLVAFTSCEQKGEATKTADTAEVKMEKETMPEKKVMYDTNDPKSMLMAVADASGGMDKLKALNDVEFEYHYVHPDGKMDISKERYIFEKEVSWAKYMKHEINVAPEMEGDVVQFFDGEKAMVHAHGEMMEDPQLVGTGQFLRQANYMWFTMMFKLTDPGTVHTYKGQEEVDGKTYDVVEVTYDASSTGKEQNDIYIVYINPESKMVEQFYFSLPAFGVEAPVLLAKVNYKDIDGVKVIDKREMFAPNPEGGMAPMVTQTLKDIKFNNGFTAEKLSKDV